MPAARVGQHPLKQACLSSSLSKADLFESAFGISGALRLLRSPRQQVNPVTGFHRLFCDPGHLRGTAPNMVGSFIMPASSAPAHAGDPDPSQDFDQDYLAWRKDQLDQYDRDYASWRQAQARRHDEEYIAWRRDRASPRASDGAPLRWPPNPTKG